MRPPRPPSLRPSSPPTPRLRTRHLPAPSVPLQCLCERPAMTGVRSSLSRPGVLARSRRSRWFALTAVLAAAPLLAGMAVPPGGGQTASVAGRPVPPAQKPVPVYPVQGRTVAAPATHAWKPAPVTWPGSAAVSAPSGTHITMASRQAAAAAGVSGVIFTVSRTAPTSAPGRAHVTLDYSSFRYAYGGDYASRLRLVELPGCVLATPQVAACRRQVPLASSDNVQTSRLSADVTLPGASGAAAGHGGPGSAAPAVIAASTSPSGSAGDFSATPLSEAGSWSAGGSSGAFTYSYPVSVPPVPGGLEPKVSLDYNSQAVDGLTSSTSNEASWIGDGWDYSPGFVERSYQPCSQTSHNTGDLCSSSNDTTTLSLNGTSTTLVQDGSTGSWHPEADNGERVQYTTGGINGTVDGGYWVVTTTDGTQYFFGRNELPGYASGDTQTHSAWTVPVYSGSAYATQAWRWNLDYVVDTHSDAVTYFYQTETNYYAENDGTTVSAAYIQAGALSQISYGLRAGSVYGVTPGGEVTFSAYTNRGGDTPTDLSCVSGAACAVWSPTFWGRYQLYGITAWALKGSALVKADSWGLAQSYAATGDASAPPPLWLVSLATRASADLGDGYTISDRIRVAQVTTETGGKIVVNYSSANSGACLSGSFPAADANTGLCYPDFWTPSGKATVQDWFNKYVVVSVSQVDTTGGGLAVVTGYAYGGGAWHYDDDSLTRSAQRTWDQWRGFRTVTATTGTSPDPVTLVADTYFQGMNGDYQASGGTSSVSVTDTKGDTVPDSDQFAGMAFEHIAYNGRGGAVVTDTVTLPWTSAATASRSQPSPLPALTAYLTGTAQARTFTALAAGGNRESDVTYTHDSYGRVTSASAVPDTSDASQDTCTTTGFASNTSSWLLDLPAGVRVVSVPCTATPSFPANAVSDTLYFYDQSAVNGAAPGAGNVTMTRKATSYSGSAPVYTTQSAVSYDPYGRALTSADADNRVTATAYAPASGAEPTSVSVTDPAGLVTTTTYDPARDLPLTVANPAAQAATRQYDALGR